MMVNTVGVTAWIRFLLRTGGTYALVTCFSLFLDPLQAEIYKWTDENGQVHFGDRPPDQKAQKIEMDVSVSDSQRLEAERINQEFYQIANEIKKRESQEAAARQREQVDLEKRKSRCKAMQRHVNVINTDYAFYDIAQDGSKSYLTDEDLANRRKQINSKYASLCGDILP